MIVRCKALAPLLLLGALSAGGCAGRLSEVGREPALTPVGAGLRPNRVAELSDTPPPAPQRKGNSLWHDAGSDLFRDPRAARVGDVVTVKISIKDKASLDNTSERSRDSKNNLSIGNSYDINYGKAVASGSGKVDSAISSNTSSKGDASIARSESIELLVAAVVADVLPNGNLVISGTQEVRVNQEVRVLNVAGVLRPRDIATDNSVSYDKIAEARISYGGRGRMTEVQQPAWGHQLIDLLAPF